MPRGGARVNSGPPPDPNALRRDRKDDRDGWTTLPQRTETPVPQWPLAALAVDAEDESMADVAEVQHERELAVWRDLWATPQATAWHRFSWTLEVALYVRLIVDAERTAAVKALAEARMWSDRLGLNPAAMLRNRWRVAPDQVGERRAEKAAPQRGAGSVRDRLKAVNGGA